MEKKNKGGRTNKYETEWKHKLHQIEGWARDGLIDKEIALKIGIATGTLYEWKNKYPEFANALKEGKESSDYLIEQTLFKRALGYEHEEVTVTEEIKDGVVSKRISKTKRLVEPNVTAMIFWLKNRKPDVWNDKKPNSLDYEEQVARIEKINAQIERLKGVSDNIEDISELRRLLVDDE